jgi:drug/metabolite transporter (DMT)-like permease
MLINILLGITGLFFLGFSVITYKKYKRTSRIDLFFIFIFLLLFSFSMLSIALKLGNWSQFQNK